VLLLALLVLLETLGRATGWLGGPGPEAWHARLGLTVGPALAVVGVAYVLAPLEQVMPLSIALVLVGAGLAVSCWKVRWPRAGRWLTLRALLPVPFVLGLLLYPMLHTALDAQRRMQVERALDQFGQGQDPRLVFAIEQALQELAADSLLGVLLTTDPDSVRLDSLADAVLRGSLLGSLTGTYEVNLTFFDRERRPIGRYEGSPIASGAEALAQDAAEFAALWQAFRRSEGRLPFIMQLGGRREPGRLQVFVESDDITRFNFGDNLTVAPNGHLIVCEDQYTRDVDNHLRGVTPDGGLYAFGRLHEQTELAGACFSPDGSTLFVNVYSPGRTLAITGPWESFRS